MNFPKWVGGWFVVLSAVLMAGCGSGSGSSETSAATSAASAPAAHPHAHELGPLVVAGGGSQPFRVAGKHDNGPVDFGKEASRAELAQAAAALHGYLVARVLETWPKACTYLSRPTKEWIEGAAARRHLGGSGCAVHLEELEIPLTGGPEVESSDVEAHSLRAQGGSGFLFYRANEAPFRMLMEKEDGTWKVANVEQNALTCGYCDRSYNRIP